MDALACKCEHPRIKLDPLEAPYIFLGRVSTVGPYSSDPKNLRKACFSPEYIVRGEVIGLDREFCVVTGVGGGDCGLDFQPGESWMVYAGTSKDDAPDAALPYTGLCWATRKVRRMTTDASTPALPSLRLFFVGATIGAAALLVVQKLRRSTRGGR